MGWFYLKLLTWGIEQDDPDAMDVGRRLRRIWPRLKPEDQVWVLGLAETYAKACMAERTWNPKAHSKEFARMRRLAQSALRLASDIEVFSKQSGLPRGFRKVIQGRAASTAITALRDLAGKAVLVVLPVKPLASQQVRGWAAKVFQRLLKTRTGLVRWELFSDLVWLASGKHILLSERTARRDARKKLLSSISSKKKAAATRS